MRALVYLVPIALVVALGYVAVRVWRSWRATGERWGGGSPSLPRLAEPADLDEDVRQADALADDRAARDGDLRD
jgi:hypothetical protein